MDRDMGKKKRAPGSGGWSDFESKLHWDGQKKWGNDDQGEFHQVDGERGADRVIQKVVQNGRLPRQ